VGAVGTGGWVLALRFAERPRECGAVVEVIAVSSSDDSQSAPRSRLPLSNRADRQNGSLTASNVRMAKEEGTRLREEATFDSLGGVEAVTWGEGVERFDAWYDGQRDTKIVVENAMGEQTAFQTPNRFTPEYREMLYAKAQSLERGLRERWGRLLHTAMVTLTCSTTDDDGRPRPPVEHLRDLLSSWEAVRRALSRVLDGREWEYLAILEPHESGHAHVHLGVFVKGPVVAEQFQPVLDAHLRNCRTAREEAHQILDDDGEEDTVRVRRASHPSRDDGVENLGAYLASYMAGEYGAEATEMPEYVRGFYATVWATGNQWFRPSNGAQELMEPPDSGEEERLKEDWSLVGVAPNGDLDEEVIEIDPEEAGGVPYRRLKQHDGWPGDPPPG
jgi:hypothetical protein